jgi:hypothetical protein
VWDGLTTVLEGSVVRLEPLASRHERGLYEVARGPRIWRWLPYDASGSCEAFGAWFEETVVASEAGREGVLATIDVRTGRACRWAVPATSTSGPSTGARDRLDPDLCFRVGHGGERRSQAADAGSSLRASRLHARRVPDERRNERSRNALEALPARFDGVLRNVLRKHKIVHSGEILDTAYYSIVDDEWPEVRPATRTDVEVRSPSVNRCGR